MGVEKIPETTPLTATGERRVAVGPSPSDPYMLKPQHFTR